MEGGGYDGALTQVKMFLPFCILRNKVNDKYERIISSTRGLNHIHETILQRTVKNVILWGDVVKQIGNGNFLYRKKQLAFFIQSV
jgi:hypothetical protein